MILRASKLGCTESISVFWKNTVKRVLHEFICSLEVLSVASAIIRVRYSRIISRANRIHPAEWARSVSRGTHGPVLQSPDLATRDLDSHRRLREKSAFRPLFGAKRRPTPIRGRLPIKNELAAYPWWTGSRRWGEKKEKKKQKERRERITGREHPVYYLLCACIDLARVTRGAIVHERSIEARARREEDAHPT